MTYGAALAALADPTRRIVFERIAHGPVSAGAAAQGLPVSRPAVSQHLAVLKAAGLVRETRAGTQRIYSLERRGLEELRRWLDGFWDVPLARFKALAEQETPHADDHPSSGPRREDHRRRPRS